MDRIIEAADFVLWDLAKEIKEGDLWVLTVEKRNNRLYIVPKNINNHLEIEDDLLIDNKEENGWNGQETHATWEWAEERDDTAL